MPSDPKSIPNIADIHNPKFHWGNPVLAIIIGSQLSICPSISIEKLTFTGFLSRKMLQIYTYARLQLNLKMIIYINLKMIIKELYCLRK